MISDKIVVIPFNIPWDWSTDYTNQTATILSKKNIVVCFLWEDALSIKEYITLRKKPLLVSVHSKNLFLYKPIHFFPFRRFMFITSLNLFLNIQFVKSLITFIELKLGKKEKVVWLFHPNFYKLVKLLGKGYLSVYDCVDYWISESGEEKKIVKRNEEKLLKEANVVTAISKVLQSHLKKKRKKVFLVPQGFRVDDFAKSLRTKSLPNKLKKVLKHKKIIGFAGGINNRLNFNLIIPLIENNPQWKFVIWGPVQKKGLEQKTVKKIDKLLSLSNVVHGVFEDRKKLPSLIRQFDVGIIPYDSSDKFNLNCYPMKIFEYFYVGIPTASTTIIELKRFPKYVKIGETVHEWETIIKAFLSKKWSEKYKKEQKLLGEKNSWEAKISAILNLINPN